MDLDDSRSCKIPRQNPYFNEKDLFSASPILKMIEEYKASCAEKWAHELSSLSGMKSFVYGKNEQVVDGEIKQPVHSHQRRIPKEVLDEAVTCYTNAFTNKSLDDFTDFESLFLFMKDAGPESNFQQVCVYDTSSRMIMSANRSQNNKYSHLLPSSQVYLHRGALYGAQTLWKIDTLLRIHRKRKALKPLCRTKAVCDDFPYYECSKPMSFFCKELQSLGSSGLEDFLCTYHRHLRNYYIALAKKLSL